MIRFFEKNGIFVQALYSTILRLTNNNLANNTGLFSPSSDPNLECKAARQMLNFNATQFPTLTATELADINTQGMFSANLFAGDVRNEFYNDLNSLSSTGLSNRVPMIAVSFSNGTENPDKDLKWLHINPPNAITDAANALNNNTGFFTTLFNSTSIPQVKDFTVKNGLALAGSKITETMVTDDKIAVPIIKDVVIERFEDVWPTFIPYNSALKIKNGVSMFCIPKHTKNIISTRHNEFPSELIKSISAQILYNKSIINNGEEYNFYENTATHIPKNLTINGTMYVNNGSVQNNGQPLTSNSTFDCYVTCPASNVTVNNGGIIELGDLSANNIGNLTFQKEIVLDIKSGGKIIVNNGSTLTIDPNCVLLYNSGATIVLNGPDAVLHIKGELRLGANAHFKIEGGNQGKGYIIWENNFSKPAKGPAARLTANFSNKFILENTNSNNDQLLAMKVRGEDGFNVGNKLGQLVINKCRVDLGAKSKIVTEAKNTVITDANFFGDFMGSYVEQYKGTRTSQGLHILGTTNTIKNVNIFDMHTGMTFIAINNRYPLMLTNVNFRNCKRALFTTTGVIKWTGGSIDVTSGVVAFSGLESIGSQDRSNFIDVDFSPQCFRDATMNKDYTLKTGEYCAAVKAHGASYNTFNFCKIAGDDKGMELREAYIKGYCNYFRNNKWSLDNLENSNFDIGGKVYNKFIIDVGQNGTVTNYGQFKSRFMGKLNLANGYNFIHGHNYNKQFITGHINPINMQILSNSSNTYNPNSNIYGIPAENNTWELFGGNNQTIFNTPSLNANVNMYYWNTMGTVNLNLCNNPSIGSINFDFNYLQYCINKQPKPGSGCGPCERTVNATIGRGATKFRDLADDFIYKWGNEIKIRPLMEDLNELIDTMLPDSFTPVMYKIYTFSRAKYAEFYNDTTIPDSLFNIEKDLLYYNMINTQDNLIMKSNLIGSMYSKMKFELKRDRALIMRIFGHRNLAINYINMILPEFETTPINKEALLTWRCLIKEEQDYIDSLIPYDSLNFFKCVPNYYYDDSTDAYAFFGHVPPHQGSNQGGRIINNSNADHAQWVENTISKNGQVIENTANALITDKNVMLYPNPAQQFVIVQSKYDISSILITDLAGKVILKLNYKSGNVHKINTTGLAQGLYNVQIISGNTITKKNLIITNN